MKNIIRGLSDDKRAEIALIAETIYQIGYVDGQASSTVEDTMVETFEHEGKMLRKVDRIACEGDIVIFTQLQADLTNSVTAGKKYEVITAFNEPRFISDSNGKFRVYEKSYKRTLETVAVFEAVAHEVDKPAPLTANQQRAKVIQRTREFKEKLIDDIHGYYLITGNSGEKYLCDAIFKHNYMKRTTTCILVGAGTGYTRKKAVVHCHPNEVFNEPLGEVISLYKALQIDIPQEFLEAVQPDTPVVGAVVETYESNGRHHATNIVDEVQMVDSQLRVSNEGKGLDGSGKYTSFDKDFGDKIIDDTNAKYESAGESL